MNVYDFDNTILKGDTEWYFFDYINDNKLLSDLNLKKIAKLFKKRIINNRVYIKNINKYYKIIVKNINNLEENIIKFWEKYKNNIKSFYIKNKKDDDVISSATPAFLLTPIFKYLKINNYIAPEYNFKTYKFNKNFNYGKNKVKNFIKQYGNVQIENFYSDSDSDIGLAKLAKTPIKVTDEKLENWVIK